jgi:CRP-like cAMP-binding protein/uncharacterized protein (DUF2249 family)
VEGIEESGGACAESYAMSQENHIDLRGLAVSERKERLFDQFDRLPPGETFTFVVDNEPRGLTSLVEERRKSEVVIARRRVSSAEWHVTVRRSPSAGEEATARTILARTQAFSELDPGSLELLAASASIHALRRGEIVADANSELSFIGVPFEGTFATTNDAANARYRVFYEITPYEIFGLISMFDGGMTPGRLIALSKTARYLRIPHASVFEVAKRDADLFRRLGVTVAQRMREMMHSLGNLATTPVIERIAKVLLPYAVPDPGLAPALAPLPNLTQAHIAAAAGTVKEVAARSIAELEAQGYLLRERGHIRFLDRQKLIELTREPA